MKAEKKDRERGMIGKTDKLKNDLQLAALRLYRASRKRDVERRSSRLVDAAEAYGAWVDDGCADQSG